jgi:hypothetical protein
MLSQFSNKFENPCVITLIFDLIGKLACYMATTGAQYESIIVDYIKYPDQL